jgi:hypothetical protein
MPPMEWGVLVKLVMPGTRVRLRRPEHMPLCRASTSKLHLGKEDADGRDKPGHDEKRINFQVVQGRSVFT